MLGRWLKVSAAVVMAVGVTAAGCSSPEPEATDPTRTVVTSSSTASSSTPSSSPATSSATKTTSTTAGTTTSAATTSEEDSAAAAGEALAALNTLAVKGRAPRTGYDRDNFGPAWADTDRNGCDTRNDILARDLNNVTFRPGTNDCLVHSGVLNEPYTATQINFLRGPDTSPEVHIDHVVALADAWQKGAQQLDEATRLAFANDPLNLLAVDGPTNMQKSAGDAATWLPANRAFRCEYVARQIGVKATYDLWVTQAEKDAMARVLSDCPDQALPVAEAPGAAPATQITTTRQPAAVAAVVEQPAPAPAPEPAPAVVPAAVPAAVPAVADTATDPRFSSCKKAKAAGYGPYVSGVDPEYAWYRDGDNDGINCE